MIIPGYSLTKDSGVFKETLRERDVYLAGPFFSEEQIIEMQAVERACEVTGLSYFSPMRECRYRAKVDPPIVAERAFALNRHHVERCQMVIAVLTHSDVGTAWELGFADAHRVPRLGVVNKNLDLVNLMVRGTVDHIVHLNNAAVELEEFFSDYSRSGRLVAVDRLKRRALSSDINLGEME